MTVSVKFLPVCTEEQQKMYMDEASKFIADIGYYSDVKYSATLAITEYIAYQNGFTIRNWVFDKLKGK